MEINHQLHPGVFYPDRQGNRISKVVDVIVGIGLGFRRGAGEQAQSNAIDAVSFQDLYGVTRLSVVFVDDAVGLEICQERQIRPGDEIILSPGRGRDQRQTRG
jgi:hypothetical protein